jgi:hypothetical protein
MTAGPSNKPAADGLVVETEPSAEDVRFLEDGLIDFNIEMTGITDGSFIGIFLRGSDGSRTGGLTAGCGAAPAMCAISSLLKACASKAKARA